MLTSSLILACAIFAQAPAPASAQEGAFIPVDELVAIVNDRVLTSSEVYREAQAIADQRGLTLEEPGLIGSVAQRLITDMLFASGFERAGLDNGIVEGIVTDEIERKIREFGSVSAYERHLASQGTNISLERRNLRLEIVATYFQQSELGIAPELGDSAYKAFLRVSPQEVREYYAEHQGNFTSPRLVNTRIMMVRADGDGSAAQAVIDEAIAASATDPLAFGAACEQHSAYAPSRNSLTGMVDPSKEDILHAFSEFLSSSAQGEFSPVVKIPGYLVVVQAHEVQDAKSLSVGEAQRRIESELLSRKRRVALQAAIDRERERSYVWIIAPLSGVLDDVYGLKPKNTDEL